MTSAAPGALDGFHPAVATWFRRRFPDGPSEPQVQGWPRIREGVDTLIAAPTGSGKTLTGFLVAIDALYRSHAAGAPPSGTRVVYVSPLKALAVDIHQNLLEPLAGIAEVAAELGMDAPALTVAVRTGDTPARARSAMLSDPPTFLVTTPESLYLLLTSERSRAVLDGVGTVIVDEIHALARDKRGAHLALTLERLDHVQRGARPQRVGLSATQRPIEHTARLLAGAGAGRSPSVVDCGHRRRLAVSVEVPSTDLEAVASTEQMGDVLDRIAAHVLEHRTTLVFVNTRRLAERLAHELAERLGHDRVAAHHGSLSKDRRLRTEERLRAGELRALVATASLELGIDIGPVELVCQIGSPRSIATFVQRVGRSNHSRGGTPEGILFPLTRDELVECAALLAAVRSGDLDATSAPAAPLDILAQQVVAEVAASGEWEEQALYELFRRAAPYADLAAGDYEEVLRLLAEGITTGRGRRMAYVHRDQVNGILRPRKGARLAAITSGGAIPEVGDYRVLLDPDDTQVGSVHEDFAVEAMVGDVFLLGTHSWRVRRVEQGVVRVTDAEGAHPTVPFWLGEALGRTDELSRGVSELRRGVAARLAPAGAGDRDAAGTEVGHSAARRFVQDISGLDEGAAGQVVAYLAAGLAGLGVLPTHEDVVFERFFDDAGGMQLVVHAPFGSRLMKAWGLALRKRFCATFDFELQAAASDDALVLSLGLTHSFPMETAARLLRSGTAASSLSQAVLASPMFTSRWRWNLNRSLAVLRFRGGRRAPIALQRMEADDLMAAVFPALSACQENMAAGPVPIPDHVLVRQTLHDCLHEAMDVDGLVDLLGKIEGGQVRAHFRESSEPSVLAHEILQARPYSFLDDAPLEERRARAVATRRGLPVDQADLSVLDPDAIARVREEVAPAPATADELHDLLCSLIVLRGVARWRPWFEELAAAGRASLLERPPTGRGHSGGEALDGDVSATTTTASTAAPGAGAGAGAGDGAVAGAGGAPAPGAGAGADEWWCATERRPWATALFPSAGFRPGRPLPPALAARPVPDADEAAAEVVRGHLDVAGPVTVGQLAERTGLTFGRVRVGLGRLEAEGFALSGRYDPALGRQAAGRGASEPGGQEEPQWCSRRLLARIHASTRARLRREIEPVTAQDLMRFLLQWQHVAPGSGRHGRAGVAAVIEQLQGFELPAGAWEEAVFPSRVEQYSPRWLEDLCLSGQVAWGRLGLRAADPEGEGGRGASTPSRATPLTFVVRDDLPWLLRAARGGVLPSEPAHGPAKDVLDVLRQRGALFHAELRGATGRLPVEVEEGLWDLVARGLVTADGFQAVRSLLSARETWRRRQRAERRSRLGARRAPTWREGGEGRWSLLPEAGEGEGADDLAEAVAEQLLVRWGVVFWDLVAREHLAVPWREVIWALRRFEARGLARGGRFVTGFAGEQYALPEALEGLRRIRRAERTGEIVRVNAADPLNLVGIVLPGNRIPAVRTNWVTYRDGLDVSHAAPAAHGARGAHDAHDARVTAPGQ